MKLLKLLFVCLVLTLTSCGASKQTTVDEIRVLELLRVELDKTLYEVHLSYGNLIQCIDTAIKNANNEKQNKS